jgi:hypothetical protein
MNSNHFRPAQFVYDDASDTIPLSGRRDPSSVWSTHPEPGDPMSRFGLPELQVEAAMYARCPAHHP